MEIPTLGDANLAPRAYRSFSGIWDTAQRIVKPGGPVGQTGATAARPPRGLGAPDR